MNIIIKTSFETIRMKKKIENMNKTFFYIGIGKTGSSTICESLINRNVFHSHSSACYDQFYDNILSNNNLTCYDLVKLYGEYFNYKPLIIESIREPISLMISLIGQFTKNNFNTDHLFNKVISKEIIDEYIKNNDIKIRASIICKIFHIILEHFPNYIFTLYNNQYFETIENFSICDNFNKDKCRLYHEFEHYSLLIIKFENIKKWKNIFNEFNIEYEEHSKNLTSDFDFGNIKNEIYKNPSILGLTTEKLKEWYSSSDNYLSNFYTNNEIESFINKWKCD